MKMLSSILYLVCLLGIEAKYLLIKLNDPNALGHGLVGQPIQGHGLVGQPMQGQMLPKRPAGVVPRPAGGLGQIVPRRPAGVMMPRPAVGGFGHILPQMMPMHLGPVPILPIWAGLGGSGGGSSSSSSSR